MRGIHRAGCVEVAVGLLRGGNERQDAVDVGLQTLVGERLQEVGGALDGFVDVGVVEWESADADGVGRMDCAHEIVVAARRLAFTEGQRDGHVAARAQARCPE